MLEFFTSLPSKSDCQQIANALVKQKLAVCVSFWPVSSVYRWKGKVHKAGEWILCIKTSGKLGEKAEEKLRKLHPYALPMIIITKVKVDRSVAKWVSDSITKG